jgi:KUP system potassium uptake protein
VSADDRFQDVPADEQPPPQGGSGGRAKAGLAALTLGALGVVFGDIGTSPLYAMKETFSGEHDIPVDPTTVYGVLSLIFWAITIVVTSKYVLFIMRADNEGEGGVMALISLIRRSHLATPRAEWLLVALGAFGASLFYGDGMITPAISVMSAVEGLEVVSPSMETFVVPAALVILSTLFFVQRFGTGPLGRFFGPVMATWFGSLAIFGLGKVMGEPSVLRALSPTYAVDFFTEHGGEAFLSLGSVVLAITGAEALYADMGHFGRKPIRTAWFLLVLPALFLNYLGQGALLLGDSKAIDNPFFRLVPEPLLIPMVVLATVATVIASQAVISGAFSVTRQAVQLGFLPLLTIRHTSKQAIGQIYVPAVNWSLFAAVAALVVGFGSSSALASAYGIAVTGTLAIDTILAFVVVRALWHKPLWLAIVGATGFLTVDLAFLAANLPKIPTGGWFPLVVGLIVFTILMTWRRGREVVGRRRAEEEGPLLDFVKELQSRDDPPTRVPGTAIFLNARPDTTPLAMRYNVEHNHVLHELNVVVYVESVGVPYVPDGERTEVDDLAIPDDGISLVTTRFGFQDEPNVPRALRDAECDGQPIDLDNATYFLSRITVSPGGERTMVLPRKRLFSLMTRNSASRWSYFELPEERVVAFGSNIEV